jgi:phosphatidylinositol alpha-1,6-mannosyltransferase
MTERPREAAPVLLVTRNFPPLVGGMENVNLRLLQALAEGGRVALCGPGGCAPFAPEAAEIREAPARPLWRFVPGTLFNALASALRLRPRTVLAGSGLAAPLAWLAARATGARFVVYLHGLDLIVANRAYQWLWLPFIRRCDLALVNSRHTAGLAAGRGIPAGRVAILHPGTSMPSLDPGAAAEFRQRHALGANAVLLSVGRLTRRKGLAEFVSKALPTIVAQQPDVLLVVIGEEAVDALHGGGTLERGRIEAAAEAAGVGDRVRFLGRLVEDELGKAYQAAQVHVFPVLDTPGDVEGFGMVALESASHGLATAAFEVGGVGDAVDPGASGTLVAAGEYDRLAAAILALLRRGPEQAARDRESARTFAARFEWRNFGERLRLLLANSGGEPRGGSG